ncbi:MAG: hypothetical protein WD557_18250 [Dehalococcoidia bacterium]
MSFDVFLQAFAGGEPAVRDRAVLEALLEPHAAGSAEEGVYVIRLQDGSEAEVFAAATPAEPFAGCICSR